MTRIILIAGLLLGTMVAAVAAPMAVPSVTSSETIVYQNPELVAPTNPPSIGPDCSPYPGTVAFGMDCVPIAGPTNTSTGGGGCIEGQYMRNGICVNRTYAPPPPTNILYPREVQTELKRVGCLAGRVDGIWGNGSRSGLRKFYGRAGLSAAGTEPTQVVLSDVQSQRGRICPAVYVAPRPKKTYPTKTVTTGYKPKCSKIKYAYTKGGTCKCSGGRKFNGKYCVQKFPPTTTTTIQVHSDQASGQTVIDIIKLFDKPKKKKPEYTPKCYKECDDCQTICE